jgi:asparagine synthase (glutamine-hydrolysing)
MCGIAGAIGFPNSAEIVARMTADLRHRGPDGDGFFSDGDLALGHRRLAILDLGDTGRQPMTSRDDRFTIVLNGEVFNYVELRRDLDAAFRAVGRGQSDAAFRGQSDTEVLLEACAAWGVETTLRRANGMFAFALWDARERELTLARDRVGEKPLVYFARQSTCGPALAFASELKALHPLSDRRLDPAAVDAYLALGYVPAPLSIFRDCSKLAPGHLLRFRDGKTSIHRWWFPENAIGRDDSEPTSLRRLLGDSVRLRLRSDVPVAICLSGGIDSSIVAVECVRLGVKPEAFTVAFDGDAHHGNPTDAGNLTDANCATLVAKRLDLSHQVIPVRATEITSHIESFLDPYDEPFADNSAFPSFALARALAGQYKVVLDGDGGDEAFGGYRHYERIHVKQAVKAIAAAAGFRDGWATATPLENPALQVYVQSKTLFRAEDRTRMMNGNSPRADSFARLLASDRFLACAGGGALKRALWTDRHLYLPNDLAYKMDIALAAHGIEGRAPFLDHRLLEWSQGLDARDLVCGSEKKVLLRAAYRGILPDRILDRPKLGFGAPIGKWLAGPLREFANDLTPCPLLDPAGHKLTGDRQWVLVAFSNWARRWRASW